MDGLLIDSEPLWQDAEIDVFARIGIQLTREDCKQIMGLRTDEVVNFWFAKYQWTQKSKGQILQEIHEEVNTLIKSRGTMMPGVNFILDFFRKKNIRIALASSSHYSVINAVVDHFKLHKEFELIYSGEEEEYGKPHPAIFISTFKKLGLHASECLVFEDSFYGTLAAKAALAKVVTIPIEEYFHQPRFQIADLLLHSLEDFSEEHFRFFNQ